MQGKYFYRLVGRDHGLSCWLWAIMLSLECMMNWEPLGISTPAVSWVSVSSSWRSQEAPCVGAVTSSTLLLWLPPAGLGSVEGWWRNEGARVTCGRFMEEIDTHVQGCKARKVISEVYTSLVLQCTKLTLTLTKH